jgi:UDP-N-acetylmuramoylalanine--D-glutamate ligase
VDLLEKRVLVVGLGKSGVASALFLKSRGAQVTVSDAKPSDQLQEEIPLLLDQGIAVETGGHGERTFRGQDLIVVSPGVPVDARPLVQARALGETVIGEIELASQFLSGTIVAITGSNGKTTTTTLAGEIVTAGGFRALVGGNIGTPAVSLVAKHPLKPLSCWKFPAFSWKPFRPSGPKSRSYLTSLPTILTAIGLSLLTLLPRRESLKIKISPISQC